MKFKRGDTVEYISPDGDTYGAEVRNVTEDGSKLWIMWHDMPRSPLQLLEADRFRLINTRFPLCFKCIQKLAKCTCGGNNER
jgi:hypothetical protein